MRNAVQDGLQITTVAPYDVASGAGCQVGAALFGVVQEDALSGDPVVLARMGVYDLTSDDSDVVAGDIVWWDNTAKAVTSTATAHLRIGIALAASTESPIRVLLATSVIA